MGVFKKFFNQTRKPGGLLGSVMLKRMNKGHARLADWGIAHLKKVHPDTILDIGCGGGRHIGKLLDIYGSATGTAIDYSELSVRKTSKYNKRLIASNRLTVRQADVSDLDIADDTYQLATAFETIYFWTDITECFKEVRRVLRAGGYFMIVNESDGNDEVALQFEKIIDGMNLYTPKQIEEALKCAGFSKIRIYHHKDKPWITLIAKK